MADPLTTPQLRRFHGGLRLQTHKSDSAREPLAAVPLPEQIILPLHQHFGAPARPVVDVGERVLRGTIVAEADGYVSAPVHASSSGVVVAVEDRPVPNPSGGVAPCIVIDLDGEDLAVEPEPVTGDYHHQLPAVIRSRVRSAGIVGLGGAAFPASVKLTTPAQASVGTLILNGAECEPYIACDDTLMRERPERIVEGARIMMHALQVNICLVAVEADKPEAADALRKALAKAADERLILVEVPTIYPEGGERQLVQTLSGLEVPFDGLPLDIGYVVHNVATAAAVADAVLDGLALDSRIVTITGPGVRAPRNVEARIGTPVARLIEFAGGYGDDIERLLMGGAMMGFALRSDNVPVVKATNCLLALTAKVVRAEGDERACIRCGECARVCPASLLPQELHWHIRADHYARVQDFHVFSCIECGCCDLVCPSHIPLTQRFRQAKSLLWAQEREQTRRDIARERTDARERRLIRASEARTQRREKQIPAGATYAGGDDPRTRVINEAVQSAGAKKKNRGKMPTDETDTD